MRAWQGTDQPIPAQGISLAACKTYLGPCADKNVARVGVRLELPVPQHHQSKGTDQVFENLPAQGTQKHLTGCGSCQERQYQPVTFPS